MTACFLPHSDLRRRAGVRGTRGLGWPSGCAAVEAGRSCTLSMVLTAAARNLRPASRRGTVSTLCSHSPWPRVTVDHLLWRVLLRNYIVKFTFN